MPTQVQRRPSEPLPPTHKSMQQHQALKLALGSILTPKRPPIQGNSRPSSGSASPAFGTYSSSGAHTPVSTPPASSSSGSYYPLAHGPNSSEHLHPHHSYGHTGHGHTHTPLPPSKLGPGRSISSTDPPSEATSAHPSAPSSNHVSPASRPHVSTSSMDIEPLSMPPPVTGPHHPSHHNAQGIEPPPPTPATPSGAAGHPSSSIPIAINGNAPSRPGISPMQSMGDGSSSPRSVSRTNSSDSGSATGRGTPRTKFLETLQSKSAWDALIHGSFS